MEYLQYRNGSERCISILVWSFKPYYKWNTFNTCGDFGSRYYVLISFKPYYKWNTFNTPRTNNTQRN